MFHSNCFKSFRVDIKAISITQRSSTPHYVLQGAYNDLAKKDQLLGQARTDSADNATLDVEDNYSRARKGVHTSLVTFPQRTPHSAHLTGYLPANLPHRALVYVRLLVLFIWYFFLCLVMVRPSHPGYVQFCWKKRRKRQQHCRRITCSWLPRYSAQRWNGTSACALLPEFAHSYWHCRCGERKGKKKNKEIT